MTELLQTVLNAGDQITVVSLLLLALFVIGFGGTQPEPTESKETTPDGQTVTVLKGDRWGRPWWVFGWQYKECIRHRRESDIEIKAYVDDMRRRLERAEARADAPSSPAGSEPA